MRLLLAINSILLFASAITFLALFYFVFTEEILILQEPSGIILWLEVIVLVLILAIALFSMVYAKRHSKTFWK